MKQQDLKKVVDFYNNTILQQVIRPIEIREIYKLVKPDGMDVPYFQKMRAISIFVQGLQQQVIDDLELMFTEFDDEQEEITNDPRLSTYIPEGTAASPNTVDTTQSHTEGDFTVVSHTGTTSHIAEMRDADTQEVSNDDMNLLDATQGLADLSETDNQVVDNEYSGLIAQTEHHFGQPPSNTPKYYNSEEQLAEFERNRNKEDGFELYQEKEKLEADYLIADTSNLKRSITMKLKAINKKLEDKLKNNGTIRKIN